MSEKKISRRGFIKGLAVCSVAIPFLPQIVEVKPEELTVEYKSILDNDSLKRTTRVGMPDVKWRKLNEGVKSNKSLLEMARDSRLSKNDLMKELV